MGVVLFAVFMMVQAIQDPHDRHLEWVQTPHLQAIMGLTLMVCSSKLPLFYLFILLFYAAIVQIRIMSCDDAMAGEVKTLLRQLLRGVQHLHDNWIIHRDLKASNLLLSHKGILKVSPLIILWFINARRLSYYSITATNIDQSCVERLSDR